MFGQPEIRARFEPPVLPPTHRYLKLKQRKAISDTTPTEKRVNVGRLRLRLAQAGVCSHSAPRECQEVME